MKILLINPPSPDNETWVREGRCQQYDIWGAPFVPFSLASIAGQLKNEHQVLLLDCAPKKLSLEKTLAQIGEFSPDLIFLSVSTPTIKNDLGWFAPAIKNKFPAVKITAIGIHPSVLPGETLTEFSALDFIVRSEPEITAKELVSFLVLKKDLTQVSGLALREGGKIIINQPRPFLENLDLLEPPFWPGVDFNDYIMPIIGRPFVLISIMRGCPFNCKFCASHSYNGKAIRKRSPRKIADEIRGYLKMGISDFLFWAEFLTLDFEYLKELLSELEKDDLLGKIKWVTNSRVDFVDLELFKRMKKSGCWQIVYGIEFGSDDILKLADKGGRASVAQARIAVETAKQAGIVVDGHFVMGYPGENKKTLEQTINFAAGLPLTFAHFYAASPFPGSELYEEALRNNWIIEKDFGKTCQASYNLKTADLNPEIVYRHISKAYKKFYLRPIIFWRILTIAKTPREFFNIVRLGFKFFGQLAAKKSAD
jgi:anaerobic magnesium-protoporphyrin IX monomethyl ester cyclase